MARETNESMSGRERAGNDGMRDDDRTTAIRRDIERTRGDMSRTVNEIEERLSPAHIKEQVASVTAGIKSDLEQKVGELKESVLGNYHEVKDHVKEDLGHELTVAKSRVETQFDHARTAVHDATIGKVQNMVHDARQSVSDAGTSIIDTIKANPIPAALIGVGLGWLIFGAKSGGSSRSRRSSRDIGVRRMEMGPRYGAYREYDEELEYREAPSTARRVKEGAAHVVDSAQAAAHDAGEAVSRVARNAGQRVAEVAGEASDAAVHFAEDARQRGEAMVRGAGRQLERAEHTVESAMRENPLAAGAIALAVGAAVGLSLPTTHVEDEWMGEAKDRLLEKAQSFAGEAIDKAEKTVGDLAASAGGDKEEKSEKREEKREEKKDGTGTYNSLSNGTSRSSNV